MPHACAHEECDGGISGPNVGMSTLSVDAPLSVMLVSQLVLSTFTYAARIRAHTQLAHELIRNSHTSSYAARCTHCVLALAPPRQIGFNWGAAGVSTSVWKGVLLRDVLLAYACLDINQRL